MYRSNISTTRWIIYDIFGNIGWLLFVVCLVLCLTSVSQILEDNVIRILLRLEIVCAIGIFFALFELIGERLAHLDRVLPPWRLFLGLGLLAESSLFGWVFSLSAFLTALVQGLDALWALGLMTLGAALCNTFSFLLFRAYRKEGTARH